MKDILFKSKTDMIIEELKKIKKTLDLTKERRPKHAYAKACRRYNVFLIHLNEIPELNEEKRERLKSFIEKQKAEMPQEYIIEEEEKFKRHCQLVQELGTMSAEEKRIDDPDFYRTVFPKTTENHLENRHDPGSYTKRGALLAGKKDRRDEEGSVNA